MHKSRDCLRMLMSVHCLLRSKQQLCAPKTRAGGVDLCVGYLACRIEFIQNAGRLLQIRELVPGTVSPRHEDCVPLGLVNLELWFTAPPPFGSTPPALGVLVNADLTPKLHRQHLWVDGAQEARTWSDYSPGRSPPSRGVHRGGVLSAISSGH